MSERTLDQPTPAGAAPSSDPTPVAPTAEAKPAARHRIDSIDLLRGLVIILMALDHARSFFGPYAYAPENLEQASAFHFLTRWVTHVCAPVFVLLAGLGAALYGERCGRRSLSRFLLVRGLWLIVLELTWVNISYLSYLNGYGFVQVLWVLGWSMIALAGLIWLPRTLQGAAAIMIVAGHHLLDGIQANNLQAPFSYLWGLLHQSMWIPTSDSMGWSVIYPLIPWPGVMLVGYLMGQLFMLPTEQRRQKLVYHGLWATAAFIVLRFANEFGDPNPWVVSERGPLYTVLSFLNTTKYPASVLFLLMTLGPSVAVMPWLERARGRVADFVLAFGRVPLFFYLLHFPVLHLMAVLWTQSRYGSSGWWFFGPNSWPEGYTPSLLPTYVAWIIVVLLLYPACRWFAQLKRRHPGGWLRYF